MQRMRMLWHMHALTSLSVCGLSFQLWPLEQSLDPQTEAEVPNVGVEVFNVHEGIGKQTRSKDHSLMQVRVARHGDH